MPRKTPNPIDVHVGIRVRMRRMLIGMSQEKLGDQLGLTFQQVQKYEKGSNRVGASRLYQIAQALNVPVDYFYEGLDTGEQKGQPGFSDGPSDGFSMDMLSTSEGVQLISAFFSIQDAEVRKRMLDLMKTLAQNSAE